MQIQSVKLSNFRNHKNREISFSSGINFLHGANAQGKTNILEAIYFFATTKSFQTSHEKETISHGVNQAEVNLSVLRSFGTVDLKLNIDVLEKKQFSVNSEKLSRHSKVLSNLCAVLFTPDELKIVKGGPEMRRHFLDASISQLSGAYFELQNRYEKVLASRNRLLKNKATNLEIEAFDEQFADLAAKIITQRARFIEKLNQYAGIFMKKLSREKENLILKYDSPFANSMNVKVNVLSALRSLLNRDLELGFTSIGPHREDLDILVNDKEIKVFGSQGQKRTAVLALKLAEYSVFYDHLGERPVLLLDDVFSELDASRAAVLFETVMEGQTIITGTRTRTTGKVKYNKIKI